MTQQGSMGSTKELVADADFCYQMFASPKAGNTNAAAREGRDPLLNIHANKSPKGRNGRAPRSGTIAKFAILTPLARGVKNRFK